MRNRMVRARVTGRMTGRMVSRASGGLVGNDGGGNTIGVFSSSDFGFMYGRVDVM